MIEGTPILGFLYFVFPDHLDVKPYISHHDSIPSATCAEWVQNTPRKDLLGVTFEPEAEETLEKLLPKLEFYETLDEIKKVIEEVLVQDPRSNHIKTNLKDEEFGFCVDNVNVICTFDDEHRQAKVIKIEDWSDKQS